MTIKNKVLVELWLENGCSQDEGEVAISWSPINFMVYSRLFEDMINTAVVDWLDENALQTEKRYELILQHEWDDHWTEYFSVFHSEIETDHQHAP